METHHVRKTNQADEVAKFLFYFDEVEAFQFRG